MNKVSLWDNAYDSLVHGLDHLENAVKNDSVFEYKRSVLDFCHATELLLKEMLFRINPIYIFDKNNLFDKCKDPMNPTIDELYQCKSLDVNQLCNTVKKYVPDFKCNMNIYSKQAANLRNKIQHFCFAVTSEEVKELLLKLSYQLLCPAFEILDTKKEYEPIEKRLRGIFTLDENIEQQINLLEIKGSEFERGFCYSCGSYSFFIEYNGHSFPERCYCTSCNYNKDQIQNENYYVCPECLVCSLLYCDELEDGICLNHKCSNSKDGGITTYMVWCGTCQDYNIEGICECTKEEPFYIDTLS